MALPVSDSLFVIQIRVIRALVLRDMRARFGSGFFSYLVAIGIPLSHLIGLMIFPLLANQAAPIGNDFGLFAATGVLPYILCMYPARMMMQCLVDSAPLLNFPAVKPLDVLWARAVFETTVAITVTLIFIFLCLSLGMRVWPYDIEDATAGMFTTIYYGLSLGFTGAIFYKLSRSWLFIQLILVVVMYVTSSPFILPRNMPAEIREALWFNPMFQCAEWLRLGYFKGYGEDLLSRIYILGVSTYLFAQGLVLERLVRGRIIMAN